MDRNSHEVLESSAFVRASEDNLKEFSMDSDYYIEFKWEGCRDNVEEKSPELAGSNIPKWYQTVEPMIGGSSTAKLCVSLRDGMIIGYLLPYQEDITISVKDMEAESENVYLNETASRLFDKNANSYVKQPDGVIEMDWKIRTPPGYSTFITPLLNRKQKGIRPFSMLMDTEGKFASVTVPIVLTKHKDEISVDENDFFLHVIPYFHGTTDNLTLQEVNGNQVEDEIEDEIYKDVSRVNQTTGYYRRFAWDPKPTVSITNVDSDEYQRPSWVGKELEPREGDVFAYHHYEKPKDYNSIPGIVKQNRYAWGEFLNQWETLEEWINDAMELGWVVRAPVGEKAKLENGELNTTKITRRKEEMLMSMGGTSSVGDDYDMPDRVQKAFIHTRLIMPNGMSILIVPVINNVHRGLRSYTGLIDADNFAPRTNIIGRAMADEYRIDVGDYLSQSIPIDREMTYIDARVIK